MTHRALTRRDFLATAAATVATARLAARQTGGAATLAIPAAADGPHMPLDFVGLSYEVRQLTEPGFFSVGNTGLVRAFREVSSHGVLRLGGNTGEFGYWKPTPDSPEPPHPPVREVEGQPKAEYYPVTAEAVRNLAAFLRETGWTCLYGIGMGTNTPERAAEEAAFVTATLRESLQYFQVGNEVDLFDRHLRDPDTWSPEAYLTEWLAMARAIARRVPNAVFGMPDVAARIGWMTEIAARWPAVEDAPHVTTMTHHFYFGGPATNPSVNIPNLLRPSTVTRVQGMADEATAAADRIGARVRMTEGNTCYRGGKPGLSDVFAAALWAADYSLQLARSNYSGVNLHGGTGSSVAVSVGGSLPGDEMLVEQGLTPAEIAARPHPFYTPIATFDGRYELEPVARGLQFAGTFSGSRLFADDFSAPLQATGVNATAYAAQLPDGRRSVVVLNKDLETDLEVTLAFGRTSGGRASVERLQAPAIDSRQTEITAATELAVDAGGRCRLAVPHASGVRVTLG